MTTTNRPSLPASGSAPLIGPSVMRCRPSAIDHHAALTSTSETRSCTCEKPRTGLSMSEALDDLRHELAGLGRVEPDLHAGGPQRVHLPLRRALVAGHD